MELTIQSALNFLEIPGVRAAVVVAVSVFLAFCVRFFIIRVLIALTRKTDSRVDDQIIDALKRPIFLSVLLVGFWYATTDYGFTEKFAFVIFGVLKTAAVIIWGRASMKIGSLLLRLLGDSKDKVPIVQPATIPLFEITIKVIIVAGVAYFALVAWGINVTGWLASAGVVGIAVGFAAKDTIANLFAGIFILTDAPYKLGDYIILAKGERGVVTQIGIRSTRILTRDEIEITIPNALIANSRIVNETAGPDPRRRIRVNVSVAYGSDVDRVREVLVDSTKNIDHVAAYPSPMVRFMEMGDSGLVFQIRVWVVEPVYRGRVTDMLNTQAYKALTQANIEIPYPKQDVYIKQMPDSQPEDTPVESDG